MKIFRLFLFVFILGAVNLGQLRAQSTDSIHIDCTINNNGAQVGTAQLMKYTSLGDGSTQGDGVVRWHSRAFFSPVGHSAGRLLCKDRRDIYGSAYHHLGHENEIAFNYSQVRDDNTPNAHLHLLSKTRLMVITCIIPISYSSNATRCLILRNRLRCSLPEKVWKTQRTCWWQNTIGFIKILQQYDGTPAGILVCKRSTSCRV